MKHSWLAVVLLSSGTVHAQTGSSYFDGQTSIQSGPMMDEEPGEATSGMCSYWYNATQVPQEDATIIATYPFSGSTITGFQIAHILGTDGLPRLYFFAQDAPGANDMAVVTQDPIPYSGWHNATITWDSTSGRVYFAIDGIVAPPLYLITGYQNWSIPAVGSNWIIGASLSVFLTPYLFYQGLLDQVICHIGNNDFLNMTSVGSGFLPTTMEIVSNGARAAYGPLNLGANCDWPFSGIPAATKPTLCQRGQSSTFLDNQWMPLQTLSGQLIDSPLSPFDLWPSGQP